MKSYVINLDKDHDRFDFMREQLDRFGVAYERIPAVDLRSPETLARLRQSRDIHPALSGPEVGCFLSHLSAFQAILDGGERYGCIFEDDILLTQDIATFLDSERWIPKDADLVKLETCFVPAALSRIKTYPVFGKYDLRLTQENWSGTAGYIISARLCQRLLREARAISLAYDLFLYQTRYGVMAYQVTPALCAQVHNINTAGGTTDAVVPQSNIAGTFDLSERPQVPTLNRIARKMLRIWNAHRYRMEIETIPLVKMPVVCSPETPSLQE